MACADDHDSISTDIDDIDNKYTNLYYNTTTTHGHPPDSMVVTNGSNLEPDGQQVAVVSTSEELYIDSGNQKKVLYLLCIGLQSDGTPLFSFEVEPWSLLPKTTTIRPKNTD
jgi:hypothetical protein